MIQVHCPAKINTFLSVGPPHRNGYHPIRSIFQAISIHDTITIRASEGETRVTCNWDGLPEANTLTKTLRLLKELIDLPPLAIHLEKVIPTEAGLGGGSSNAAGLLKGVLRYAKTELPWAQAESIAAAVGADVSFFLVGGRAKVTGYGERVEPLPDLEDRDLRNILVVKPNISVATGSAYKKLDEMERQWRDFPNDLTDCYNDFQQIAPPECLDIIERMKACGARDSLLTGSGSAVFGVFKRGKERTSASQEITKHYPDSWLCWTNALPRAKTFIFHEVSE